MSSFLPAGVDERLALRGYLGRLVALDGRACVRLQTHGLVMGAWGGPPLDVLTLRPVALAELGAVSDVTVSAVRLSAALDEQLTGPVEVPPTVPGPAWAGLLPPRAGWTTVATVPAAAVRDAVRVGVDAFTRRVDQLAADQRSAADLRAVAEQVWGRPVVGGVPLRAAHAAELMGLLGREGEVTALASGGWLRLACPGGSVATHPGPAMGLDLFAL